MDQLENVSIMPGAQTPLEIKIEVLVDALADGTATVSFPPEARLTERLVRSVAEALQVRNLTLKHWKLSPEQQEELRKLPNVVVQGIG